MAVAAMVMSCAALFATGSDAEDAAEVQTVDYTFDFKYATVVEADADKGVTGVTATEAKAINEAYDKLIAAMGGVVIFNGTTESGTFKVPTAITDKVVTSTEIAADGSQITTISATGMNIKNALINVACNKITWIGGTVTVPVTVDGTIYSAEELAAMIEDAKNGMYTADEFDAAVAAAIEKYKTENPATSEDSTAAWCIAALSALAACIIGIFVLLGFKKARSEGRRFI